jgi:integrase
MLIAGLRLGEALGLEWKDVDLATGRIQVREQAAVVHGASVIAPLKTRSSRRIVEVGPVTLDALRRRRHVASTESHNSPYVFATKEGRLVSRSNLRRRHFGKVCMNAGIVGLTIHGLRHSMTSHANSIGISPVVVAARLGHCSTKTALDRTVICYLVSSTKQRFALRSDLLAVRRGDYEPSARAASQNRR